LEVAYDEPPTGAVNVVWLGDDELEHSERVMRVKESLKYLRARSKSAAVVLGGGGASSGRSSTSDPFSKREIALRKSFGEDRGEDLALINASFMRKMRPPIVSRKSF
jgi:hypothetical protein